MLKKTKHFELSDLVMIIAIIIILAALIAPNVITSIQKSKQENIITHVDIIEKIKAEKKNFNIYIQGIMGVNKAERELAEATEIFKERYPDLWLIKPWERNDSNLNNSGLREKKAGIQEVSNVKKN